MSVHNYTLLLLLFCRAAICSLRVFRQYLTCRQTHVLHQTLALCYWTDLRESLRHTQMFPTSPNVCVRALPGTLHDASLSDTHWPPESETLRPSASWHSSPSLTGIPAKPEKGEKNSTSELTTYSQCDRKQTKREAPGPWWPQLSRLSGWWVAVSLPALLASVATPPLRCSPAFRRQTKTVNVPFQPRSTALLSTNQLVPCCRCAAPWCGWMYPGQAEGIWDTDAGPGTKLQWNRWLDDKAVYEKENKNNQCRERRGGHKTKVIMEKEGGAWKNTIGPLLTVKLPHAAEVPHWKPQKNLATGTKETKHCISRAQFGGHG